MGAITLSKKIATVLACVRVFTRKNFQVSAKRQLSHGKEKEGKEGKREKGRGGSEEIEGIELPCNSAHADANTYMNANINYFYETYCRIGHPGAWATCHQAHCERLPLVQVL